MTEQEGLQLPLACVFDLEGTVVDVECAHHIGFICAAKDFGVELSFEECLATLPHFIGGPDEEGAKDISAVAAKRGLAVDYHNILEKKKIHYDRLLRELSIQPRRGFLDFFSTVKNAGIKYAIGSVTNQDQAVVLLERAGLADLFGYENIVLREHVQRPKPAPDVWIETAKRIGVEPSKQIVFEDSPRGINGAIEVGAYCIGMPVYNRANVITPLINAGARRIFLQWDEINPLALMRNIYQERI
ncbi:MAG: HAD family phosphatase [Nanoarchaeota archaeon]|mgnify:CR=1 FL=1